MSLTKKERTLTIWIGIAIGVAFSSMLVRYALDHKEKRAQERPGNYHSLKTASGQSSFPPLPESVFKSIPHGIVVFFDQNESIGNESASDSSRKWVIETGGAFRSERLFVLAEETPGNPSQANFYRAAELYLKTGKNYDQKSLEEKLDGEKYQIIGKNSRSGEWIVQIKNVSPPGIRSSLKELSLMKPIVEGVRLSPWKPSG